MPDAPLIQLTPRREQASPVERKPPWLKVPAPGGGDLEPGRLALDGGSLFPSGRELDQRRIGHVGQEDSGVNGHRVGFFNRPVESNRLARNVPAGVLVPRLVAALAQALQLLL